jgi:hypothetical protein
MPILIIFFLLGVIMWAAASYYQFLRRQIKAEAMNVEGVRLYGLACELKGKEFDDAKAAIEDNLAGLDRNIETLLAKYSRQILTQVTSFNVWRGFTKGEERKQCAKAEKDYQAVVKEFLDKRHPCLNKYDRTMSFRDYGWSVTSYFFGSILVKRGLLPTMRSARMGLH